MVPPRLKVEILVSWLWVKRCVFAGIKKLGWYSVGRVRVSLVLNRFSRRNRNTAMAKPLLEYDIARTKPFIALIRRNRKLHPSPCLFQFIR